MKNILAKLYFLQRERVKFTKDMVKKPDTIQEYYEGCIRKRKELIFLTSLIYDRIMSMTEGEVFLTEQDRYHSDFFSVSEKTLPVHPQDKWVTWYGKYEDEHHFFFPPSDERKLKRHIRWLLEDRVYGYLDMAQWLKEALDKLWG